MPRNILLPHSLRFALRANHVAGLVREKRGGTHDPVPVLKLFNPLSAATWLATELYDDGDTLFGLADLGFGCPELGTFSLGEIGAIRLPYGLKIERDEAFSTSDTLGTWARCARRTGSIIGAALVLRGAAPTPPTSPDPDLPPA
jgi:hypothetical protein